MRCAANLGHMSKENAFVSERAWNLYLDDMLEFARNNRIMVGDGIASSTDDSVSPELMA